MIDANVFAPTMSYPTDTEDNFNALTESTATRRIFYRLGDSELFQYANNNTTIAGGKLVDAIPGFLAQSEIMALRKSKSAERMVDIRPMIFALSGKQTEGGAELIGDVTENGFDSYIPRGAI